MYKLNLSLSDAINELKTYINTDAVYRDYVKQSGTEYSDFDKFCIKHCTSIDVVLNELSKYIK